MHSPRFLAASAFVLCAPALAACARGAAVPRDALVGWESRYVPAAQCRVSSRFAAVGGDTSLTARLVVRLTGFGSSALVDHAQIVVTPLAPLDTLDQPVVRREDASDHPAPLEASLRPGRYVLASRAFGYEGRFDTVDVRPRAADTVTLALEEYTDALRNRHNCRPRGFRRAGERACVVDQITTVLVLDRARDMASPRFRFGVGLPNGDSTDVRIVDDERVCERAARVYGLDTGPPRRVVVADAVSFYVVYDPAEPVALGELNQWLVIDRRFRVLARLAL
ncbi:MAG: hypothetical protein ACJ79A_09340 [Gemmatimonadaceae bacterium]